MSTRRVGMPMQAAMSRFCVTARMLSPSGVFLTTSHVSVSVTAAKSNREHAVPGEDEVADHRRAAGHVEGRLELQVLRAEDDAHEVDQEKAHRPGGEQAHQRALVEMPQQRRFQRDADGRRDEEGGGDGEDQIPVEQSGRDAAQALLHQPGDIGADHDQLALGEVDDAHQPEDDGEADGGHEQDRGEAQAVIERRQHVADGDAALDLGDARIHRLPEAGIGAIGGIVLQRGELGQGAASGVLGYAADGADARGGIGGVERGALGEVLDLRLQPGIALGLAGPLQQPFGDQRRTALNIFSAAARWPAFGAVRRAKAASASS